jgi:hypothetical protein
MRATSILRFTKSATNKEKYLLTERRGAAILPLGYCKRGADSGKEYVLLSPTLKNKPGGRHWDYSLYTTAAELCEPTSSTKARITGFNFENGRAHGDTNNAYFKSNHAILIQLEGDALSLFIFEGRGKEAPALSQAWTAGGLSLTAEADAEGLPVGA